MDDKRKQSRGFAFTAYETANWQQFPTLLGSKPKWVYICQAPEECPTTGRPHIQGYVHFQNACSWNSAKTAIQKVYPTAHVDSAVANAQANRKYIFGPYTDGKGKDKPINKDAMEWGECPSQGKRSDIDKVKDTIQSGGTMRDVVEQATNLQTIKMAECLLKYLEKPRNWKPEIYVLYGSTGTGKSRAAEAAAPDAYPFGDVGKWWDGYDAHTDVICNDFRTDMVPFNLLLKMIDRYAFKVETKGGTRQLLMKRMFITCPSPPELWEWEKCREDMKQLFRRIDDQFNFDFEEERKRFSEKFDTHFFG